MPSVPDTCVLLHRRFDDFDELTAAARHWDLDLMQLDRGGFEGEVVQAVSGGVLFSEGRFGRALTQQGAAPRGMRTFVVPAGHGVRFNWRGKDIRPNDLLAFPRNRELYAVSQPGFHVFTISLPETLLEEAASRAGAPKLPDVLRREKLPCPSSLLSPLRERLYAVGRAARRAPQLPSDSALLAALHSEMPELIVRLMAAGKTSDEVVTARRRNQAVKRAEAYVSEFRDRPLAVRDLCQATGVSERTLQYAFREHFGVTPKAYLRAVRLNGVRRDLKRSSPGDAKIGEIAGRWGFWHLGQLAADYKRQFGELPSQTLSDSTGIR